jgi:hypothetical protein
MSSEAVRAWAMNRGFVMAREVFRKRGNHSEVHLRLDELVALMTAATEMGAEKAVEMIAAELLLAARTPANRPVDK